ncbi:CD276 antigen-like isoform X1 [Acanthochromis polyacanthus]|uniref:CD276 antigen-like isoform X1 n=1 Tax=Acanthochromis polyacanthus TaxID=80966 RepID=UPI0022348E62|nr:CD276 antigen-like isoform X1 [Acanthochromis polyacanthus]
MKLVDLLCLLMITGSITCEDKGFIRVVVRVGEDVVLPCSLGPENIEPALFDWIKGQQEMFLYNNGTYQSGDSQFQGRVSHFPDKLKNGNASITIRNITLSDSGYYSCYFPHLQEQRFYIELVVADIKIQVKEDDDVILDCSFNTTNIKNEPFSWKKDVNQNNEKDVFLYSGGDTDPGPEFKDRVFHFPDQLQFGNASIKITKAKTSDSGTYTCYHATVQKEIKSTISLTVDPVLKPRPEIEGASPKPRIESVTVTNNQIQLQCEVLGAFPKPEVVWKDSDGKILPADEPKVTEREGNKYDTVLNVTVTKTDRYTCEATQKEIYHQINSSIAVTLNGAVSKPYISIVEETKGGVLLQCEVFGASPELKVSWKNKAGHDVPSKEPQKTENSIILQTTVTKTDYYRCVTTEGKKDDELYSEFLVPVPDGSWTKLLIGIVIGVVLTVAVGVIAWRCCKMRAGERLRAIFSWKAKQPVMPGGCDCRDSSLHPSHDRERRDSGDSSSDSSHDLAERRDSGVSSHLSSY